MSAARAYLDRSTLQVVVVGDPATVLPQLGADTVVWSAEAVVRGELPASR